MDLRSVRKFVLILILCTSCRQLIGYPTSTRIRGNFPLIHNRQDVGSSEFFRTRFVTALKFLNLENGQQVTQKIAGGDYAKDGQFPFMVVVHRLLEAGVVSQCGGTILSQRWVLTAGHCITKQSGTFLIVFGIINKQGIGYNYNNGLGTAMMTTEGIVHPGYVHITNDIGLLYMPRNIPYTNKIYPIRLAGLREQTRTYADEIAYAIGWGRDMQTSGGTRYLKYASLPIITNIECAQFWTVDDRNICTAANLGKNACQGDSGGPLVIIDKMGKPLQIGIVSYGDSNCPSNRPGVFTKVANYTEWIQNVTGIRY